jgi:hypothetical protein
MKNISCDQLTVIMKVFFMKILSDDLIGRHFGIESSIRFEIRLSYQNFSVSLFFGTTGI